MIRNVIFDFGAVLFQWNPSKIVQTFTDSKHEQQLLLNEVLRHPDWLSLDRGTMLMAEIIPKVAARTGFPESRMEDFFEHILNSLVKISCTQTLFYRLLEHHYSIYYLTNMSSAFFETLNERHSFLSLCKGGLVSGKELILKPDPEIFELLLDRYNLQADESLFIDDSEANIKSARDLGFHTVRFEQSDECLETIYDLLDLN